MAHNEHENGNCCHQHDHSHGHQHGHDHDEEPLSWWRVGLSGALLIAGLVLGHTGAAWFQTGWVKILWYVTAWLPVGLPVLHEAMEQAVHSRDYFSEFMLMSVASIGAMAIGEFPEAVAVMLLYCIGEALQDRAADRARNQISSLVAARPDVARVVSGDAVSEVKPEAVAVGTVIEVHPGERVPLDGTLISPSSGAALNTAALTGESMPRLYGAESEVLAGMIPAETTIRLRTLRPAADSAIARILTLVEEATERKAPTELFIRRFSHIYTPVVIGLAALTVLLPWLLSLVGVGTFSAEWIRRALIFLVISCPCALVISIPLGYFGGIGAASRRGILFKGGNCLDALCDVDTVVFDKTGTLTTGQFQVISAEGLADGDLAAVAAIEHDSNHPIAAAIRAYCDEKGIGAAANMQEKNVSGYGLEGSDGTAEWLVGALRLLQLHEVAYPETLENQPETMVAVAKDGQYIGAILLSDTLKTDAIEAIEQLDADTEILSGDKQPLVQQVADALGIGVATGDLLPEGKVARLQQLKDEGRKVAFVGDGMNDAPVLAAADVAFAMGGLGADMAIEAADVIIQTDQPSKVAEAMGIAQRTRRIVKQNIVLSIGIKVAVMVLGLFGLANLWEAVFADSGVALLAVLNSTRVFAQPRHSGKK